METINQIDSSRRLAETQNLALGNRRLTDELMQAIARLQERVWSMECSLARRDLRIERLARMCRITHRELRTVKADRSRRSQPRTTRAG